MQIELLRRYADSNQTQITAKDVMWFWVLMARKVLGGVHNLEYEIGMYLASNIDSLVGGKTVRESTVVNDVKSRDLIQTLYVLYINGLIQTRRQTETAEEATRVYHHVTATQKLIDEVTNFVNQSNATFGEQRS